MSQSAVRSVRATASAAGAVALVLLGLVIGVFNERGFRAGQAQSLAAQAQVLAATVQPALVFTDEAAAQEVVAALTADPRIEAAAVYGTEGKRVAEFGRANEGPPLRSAEARPGRVRGRLAVAAPVMHEGRRIGLVYLRTSPERLAESIQRHAGTALLLGMAVIVLAGAQAMQVAQRRAARESEARAAELAEVNEQLQQQIRRSETAEDALRQAQKMETLGQLTGGIAHDFNNLLQTVQGSLDLIARRAGERESVEKWARMGLEATERGVGLTSQLLAFSRSQKLEMRPVNVKEVLDRIGNLLPATLGPSVSVIFDHVDPAPLVLADATQLDLALLNLCINARDAMPNGGEIKVSTHAMRLDGDPELAPADYLVLTVTDEGVGMPEDVRARAFDPFFTTKGVGKGTGLGLAQVYGIAKQAGGVARIESAAGRGTSVSIYLPVAGEAGPSGLATARGVAAPTQPGARILVVDDDVGVRTYMCEALAAFGYECLQAADGVAGLEILEGEPVDLLIVDYAMPGLSGAEMAAKVRAMHPGLPILFASGYADSAALESVFGHAVQLLRKPFDSDVLGARVAEALSSG